MVRFPNKCSRDVLVGNNRRGLDFKWKEVGPVNMGTLKIPEVVTEGSYRGNSRPKVNPSVLPSVVSL